MAGERNVEEVIEKHQQGVLRGALVQPSRFREALEPLGVKLAEDEPIGVVDSKTIEAELKRLQVSPRFSRQAARAISSNLRTPNQLPIIFTDRRLTLEEGKVGDERFYRRSDLEIDEAYKRLGAYQLLLIREAEEVEAEKRRIEEQKAAKLLAPSTATIRGVSTFTLEGYGERVNSFSQESKGGKIVEEIPQIRAHPKALLAKVIDRKDAQRLLAKGMYPDDFDILISNIRTGIILSADEDNKKIRVSAREILSLVEERIEKPGSVLEMPIFLPRDVTDVYKSNFSDLNQNPQISFESEVEESVIGETEPIPRALISRWVNRFSEESVTSNLDTIKQASSSTGSLLEEALASEKPVELLRRLSEDGVLKVESGEISRGELDKILAPIVLTDRIVGTAIFADVIGEMYPIIYHPKLNGEEREISLFVLRHFAESFTLAQIKQVLEPRYIQREVPQIARLTRQIEDVEKNLLIANGNRQRMQALERDKSQLLKRLSGLEKQKSELVPPRDLINQALADRVPMQEPDPKDYGDGENSAGYKRNVKMYEVIKEAAPEEKPPNPEDYYLEHESEGYEGDLKLYLAYLKLTPEGWIQESRNPKAVLERIYTDFQKMNVRAMLAEGTVK